MSEDKEDWVCGDCGTQYSHEVKFCENPELDSLMLNKWNEGRLYGEDAARRELGRPVDELVKSIRVLAKYGFAITYKESREADY
jgi:hypothetical protein